LLSRLLEGLNFEPGLDLACVLQSVSLGLVMLMMQFSPCRSAKSAHGAPTPPRY
jgi:hypothetical protein